MGIKRQLITPLTLDNGAHVVGMMVGQKDPFNALSLGQEFIQKFPELLLFRGMGGGRVDQIKFLVAHQVGIGMGGGRFGWSPEGRQQDSRAKIDLLQFTPIQRFAQLTRLRKKAFAVALGQFVKKKGQGRCNQHRSLPPPFQGLFGSDEIPLLDFSGPDFHLVFSSDVAMQEPGIVMFEDELGSGDGEQIGRASCRERV